MRAIKYKLLALMVVISVGVAAIGAGSASAVTIVDNNGHNIVDGHHYCGDVKVNRVAVESSIDIGCRGAGNPIMDMMFAVIRLLSNGVGLVIIGSIIVGGIQYTMSAGDPQAAAKAIGRIRATVIALGLYIFAYPVLNYVIPSGFFK
jgi:hypothetical protein